ncbi:potassium channel family protein [Ferrimonas aestuarii]|uniref:Ion transporter n=1 Tax=Ferrimonas aestuarii TaxID=2569539 RepID=A0A4U1BRH0_9GAMM|nr:potassium channel family protein [Ferrimonas aestuarii]TKB56758.1 ion transporter [Ferrimonas aestuarii]
MTKETFSPRELGMMLLSVLSVIVVLMIAFYDDGREHMQLLMHIDLMICIIFISNFFYGLWRSDNRAHYFKEHWIDLVASIPAIEQLRYARIFQVLRVIRLARMTRSFWGEFLKHKRETTVTSLLVGLVTVLTFASVLILLVEEGAPGANITTADEAIWWAIVTISTVGYGDFYPVTSMGRIIGAIVIISGVSFFGIVAGYLASVFVSPEEEEKLSSQELELNKRSDELERKLANLEQQNQQILAELKRLSERSSPAPTESTGSDRNSV